MYCSLENKKNLTKHYGTIILYILSSKFYFCPSVTAEYKLHNNTSIPFFSEPLKRAGEPFTCGMQSDPNCYNTIGVWSFGLKGECAHPDMGFRIGKTGYKKAIFQVN